MPVMAKSLALIFEFVVEVGCRAFGVVVLLAGKIRQLLLPLILIRCVRPRVKPRNNLDDIESDNVAQSIRREATFP